MMKRLGLAALALFCLAQAVTIAWANDVTITARYRPQDNGVSFENTTPQAGFCVQWPERCNGVFTVGLPIEFTKQTLGDASNVRERAYLKLPAKRTLQVVNARDGSTHQVEFEINVISQQYRRTSVPYVAPVFTVYVSGGCSYYFTNGVSYDWVKFLWTVKTPAAPTPCYAGAGPTDRYQESRVTHTGIGYALKLPSPLKMTYGVYHGSTRFSIGPGGDFDFGDLVSEQNTHELNVNFELTVDHPFTLVFPPELKTAVLEPHNGWLNWLHGGRPPPRLYRDVPFQLWSSGPFKVFISQCQYRSAVRCAIRNDRDGHEVPVQVALTLPEGIQHNGMGVERIAVPLDAANAIQMQSLTPMLNRKAQLHFEVVGNDVKSMLDHRGSAYRGDVTVMFDAEF